jgi:hypothetical protein
MRRGCWSIGANGGRRVVLCCLMAGLVGGGAGAQTPPAQTPPAQTLPENPGAQTGMATGLISGTVTDVSGATVQGARVTLTGSSAKDSRIAVTGGDGRFRFEGIPAGGFDLSVAAAGLAPNSAAVTLQAGEILEMPPIVLRAVTSAELTVMATTTDIAEAEVAVEEQQRVIGIIPNYFVTYDLDPVPLRAKQKFGLGFHVVLDPTNFIFAGLSAGIEQASNTIPGYGQGAEGFGKRYGAALALSSSATLFRGSIYPALFRQDPRYFYKSTGTVRQRALYALATAVICKSDSGHWQPNYSGILGDLSAGALANAYYPASSRNGAALTFEDGLLSTAGVGVGHLLQEFLFRYLTTHAKRPAPTQP